MSLNAVRWSVLGVVLALIVGCGGSAGSGSGSGGSGSGGSGSGGSGSGSDTTVTFTFQYGIPTLAAVQIGSGSYAAQTITNRQLTITVPSGTSTYTVAYLCPVQTAFNPPLTFEYIQSESILDGTSAYGDCPGYGDTAAQGTLTGTIDSTAYPTAVYASVVAVTGVQPVISSAQVPGSFQANLPAGTDRVVVGLYDSTYTNLLAIKNFNNQAVPGALNSGNPVVFEAGDATTPQTITYANLPSGYSAPYTSVSVLGGTFNLGTGQITQYQQLPDGVLQSGDYYLINASASISNGQQEYGVGALAFPAAGGPVTLTFPAPWSSTAGFTPSARPTFNFDYTGFAGQTGLYLEATMVWDPTSTSEGEILVSATQSYLGNAKTITVPDLSGVSGFLAPPASGTGVWWEEYLFQQTFPSSTSAAGGSGSIVVTTGTYTVP